MNKVVSNNTFVVGLNTDSNCRFILDYIGLSTVTKPIIISSSVNSKLLKFLEFSSKFNSSHVCNDIQSIRLIAFGLSRFTIIVDDVKVVGNDCHRYELAEQVRNKYGNFAELVILYNKSGVDYIDDATELTLSEKFNFSEAYSVSEEYEGKTNKNNRRNII